MTAIDRTAYPRPGVRLSSEELQARYDLSEAAHAFLSANSAIFAHPPEKVKVCERQASTASSVPPCALPFQQVGRHSAQPGASMSSGSVGCPLCSPSRLKFLMTGFYTYLEATRQ